MPQRDVVSWNSLIAGFSRLGFPCKALRLYQRMVAAGVRETHRTFSSVLAAAAGCSLREAEQLHCRVVFLGTDSNPFVGSALVGLYMNMNLHLPELALRVLAALPEKTTAACNSVLRGLFPAERQLSFFSEMISRGVSFNGVSFSYLLHGCSDGRHLPEGKQLHCQSTKRGLVAGDLFVSNALVDLYAACGLREDAAAAAAAIAAGEVISWNSIVAVNAAGDRIAEALKLFRSMIAAGKRPSVRSLVALLNSSSRTRNLDLGALIHGVALKLGFHSGSVFLRSALIDAYGKCGDARSAAALWEEEAAAGEKSLETCNSLVTTLVHCGAIDDAFEVFAIMTEEGVIPDEVTLSATLRAASSSSSSSPSGSLVSVGELHCWAVKLGLAGDAAVASSLISAYSKVGGGAAAARKALGDAREPNLICFTAAIAAFGRQGLGKEAVALMEMMIHRRAEEELDGVAFLCALAACDHAGMVAEGRRLFQSMAEEHGVELDLRHYCCMASLLGRAGLVREAAELVERAPPGTGRDPAAWSAVLRSCGVHGEEEVGRRAAAALMDTEPRSPAACLQVAGFYAAVAEPETSAAVKEMIPPPELRREMGRSTVEVTEARFPTVDRSQRPLTP
ncbi:unnamed protein product [Spirodela intermedia]|uniref:Uncharacterized protein n=1 Tax=Spirodela intermedia TaxID=51605 RepID=A0A7I8LJY3_SPIIN|nr:unnamed protein product [Spirodela intermedia]